MPAQPFAPNLWVTVTPGYCPASIWALDQDLQITYTIKRQVTFAASLLGDWTAVFRKWPRGRDLVTRGHQRPSDPSHWLS